MVVVILCHNNQILNIMTATKKIVKEDIIFARVTILGKELMHLRIQGIESLREINSRIEQSICNPLVRFIEVNVRNFSQGWTRRYTYALSA